MLDFKKGNTTIDRFWLGDFIAFQLKNKEWQKGQLMAIRNDSIYIRPRVVYYYTMGSDTVYFNVSGYAIADVFAMPKKGYLIDYINGRFQISTSGGHLHWYWIKSGLIFKVGAAGYAALNVANGLINNNFSFTVSQLAITASVFLFGVALKHIYKPTLSIGKKYHLEMFSLSN